MASDKVSNLEREFVHLNSTLTKLDLSLEKLTTISASVTQLLAVHENRLSHQDKLYDSLLDQINRLQQQITDLSDQLHERLDGVEKELLTKINEQNTKISTIQQWMWTAAGGGAVLVFLFSNLAKLLGLG